MTDDTWKLANDRELIEYRKGVAQDLAEYQANLAAIDAEIRQRNLAEADAYTVTESDRTLARVKARVEQLSDHLGIPYVYETGIDTVPNPRAEVETLTKQLAKFDTDLGHQLDRVEELHEIADRLSLAIAPREVIGEHSSGNHPWENAIEYAESRVWAEPQVEPSEAYLRAGALSMYRASPRLSVAGATTMFRDALRAASAVTEQGETRHG